MANNVLVQHVFIMPDETAARQGKKLRALFDACASDSLESPLAQVADKLGVSLDGIDARTFEVEFVEPGDKPDLLATIILSPAFWQKRTLRTIPRWPLGIKSLQSSLASSISGWRRTLATITLRRATVPLRVFSHLSS